MKKLSMSQHVICHDYHDIPITHAHIVYMYREHCIYINYNYREIC